MPIQKALTIMRISTKMTVKRMMKKFESIHRSTQNGEMMLDAESNDNMLVEGYFDNLMHSLIGIKILKCFDAKNLSNLRL